MEMGGEGGMLNGACVWVGLGWVGEGCFPRDVRTPHMEAAVYQQKAA